MPQELGEYLVYLRSGYTPRRALFLNTVTSLTAVGGAVLGYCFLAQLRSLIPYLLAFAAAGFLYVALADLVPAQRGRITARDATVDLILMVAGIGVIALLAHAH